MAEIRETHVERDANGNVIDTKVVDRRKGGGGFGWGMLFAVLVVAGAIIAFAYSQGSFQQAGVEADEASAQIEEQSRAVAENAGDAAETAGDRIEQATE